MRTHTSNIRIVLIALCMSLLNGIAAEMRGASEMLVPLYLQPNQPIERRVDDLMQRMTLEEMLGQMTLDFCSGEVDVSRPITSDAPETQGSVDQPLTPSAQLLKEDILSGRIGVTRNITGWREANARQKLALQSRLKIPLFIVCNGIHGLCEQYGSIFPGNINFGSCWNPALAGEAARITASEYRAYGYNWNFSPPIDVAWDARWGRCGENTGEDPYLAAQIGVAMVRGFQGEDLSEPGRMPACLKHLVAGGIAQNGGNFAPVDVSERTLREYFLPPFKACVEAGVASIMPGHNDIGGIPCHASSWLLTDLLREEWGFEGLFVTDWQDMERLVTIHKTAPNKKEAFRIGIHAGIDVHNNGKGFIEPMMELVEEGRVSRERVEDSVRRILTLKFKMGLFENCLVTDPMQSGVLISDEARRIALQMARESIVLLKNDNRTLPLEGNLNVFVAGPNLESHAFLGDWVKAENPAPYTTDIKEGLVQQKPSGIRLSDFDLGQNVQMNPADIEQAVQRAAQADVAVLVVGGNHYRGNGRELQTGGENIDRSSIELAGNQLELIQKVKATGVKTVVVLVNGRPLAIEWLQKNVDAIVEAWEPGMEGGTAVAEILYGRVNPSGRLTYTFPRNTGQLQSYYNRYPSNFFRKYRFGETGPVYEFGHGLSYTTFTYSDLKFSPEIVIGNPQTVEVKVTNTGDRAGDEVMLMYINDVVSSVVTPIKKLVGFQRIGLKPGESKTVSLTIQPEQLALWNEEMQHRVEPGTFELWVGPLKKEFEVRRRKL